MNKEKITVVTLYVLAYRRYTVNRCGIAISVLVWFAVWGRQLHTPRIWSAFYRKPFTCTMHGNRAFKGQASTIVSLFDFEL